MKKAEFIIIVIVLEVTAKTAFSQEDSLKIRFDMSLRYRMEAWNGMNAKNYGDDSPGAIGKLDDKILYQRIIAGVTFEPSKKLSLACHIQDSRAFGWSLRNSQYPDLFKVHGNDSVAPNYTMNPNEEYFEIYDAYVENGRLFSNFSMI